MICSSSKSSCFYLQDIFQREPLFMSVLLTGHCSASNRRGAFPSAALAPWWSSSKQPTKELFSETLMQLCRGITVRSPSDASLSQSTRPGP